MLAGAGERESAFERDAASRHAKPACPAIWQRHGRTSESSKISERGTTATTHMQQVTKKTRVAPIRGRTATKHATPNAALRRSTRPHCSSILRIRYGWARGRSEATGRPPETQRCLLLNSRVRVTYLRYEQLLRRKVHPVLTDVDNVGQLM